MGPDFKAPEPPGVHSYAAPGDTPLPADQHINVGARIEGNWWSEFHSAALDSLIREALDNNQDIAAARARVAQAQEEVNAARATLFPSLTFGTTAGRQKYGKALFGPLDFVIPPFTYYTVGPSISAPLDLFGEAKALGVPLAAIGGITTENAPQVIAAGAQLLAVISDLFDASDIAGRARRYGKLFA